MHGLADSNKKIIALALTTVPLAALALNLEVRNNEAYPRKAVAQTDARAVFSKIKSEACHIVAPGGFTDTAEQNGHILGIGSPAADGNFDYFWGFAWDRNNPGMNLGTWTETLRRFAAERPLEVRLK